MELFTDALSNNLCLIYNILQLRGTDDVDLEMEEIAEDYRKTKDDKLLGGKGDNKLIDLYLFTVHCKNIWYKSDKCFED